MTESDMDDLSWFALDVSDQYHDDEGDAELYYSHPFLTTGEIALGDMFWGNERG